MNLPMWWSPCRLFCYNCRCKCKGSLKLTPVFAATPRPYVLYLSWSPLPTHNSTSNICACGTMLTCLLATTELYQNTRDVWMAFSDVPHAGVLLEISYVMTAGAILGTMNLFMLMHGVTQIYRNICSKAKAICAPNVKKATSYMKQN